MVRRFIDQRFKSNTEQLKQIDFYRQNDDNNLNMRMMCMKNCKQYLEQVYVQIKTVENSLFFYEIRIFSPPRGYTADAQIGGPCV